MSPEENSRVIAFYEAARAEVILRLGLREQVLIAYLTVAGLITGLAYKSSTNEASPILLIIPLLALPFTLAFIRHDSIVRRIGVYLGDMRPHLTIPHAKIRDWDGSASLHKGLGGHLIMDRLTFFSLIASPAAVCLWLEKAYAGVYKRAYWIGFIFVLTAVMISVIELARVWQLYKRMRTMR
jgi:hypothetical protein